MPSIPWLWNFYNAIHHRWYSAETWCNTTAPLLLFEAAYRMPPAAVHPAGTGYVVFGNMLQTSLGQFSLPSALEGASLTVPKAVPTVSSPASSPASSASGLSWKAALEELSAVSTSRGGELLVMRLSGLVSALSQDSVLRENGLLGGMRRALGLAQGGQVDAARQVVAELLSLATIVERRWTALRQNAGPPLLPDPSTESNGDPCSSSVSSGAFRQPLQAGPAGPSSSSCSSLCSDGDSAPPALFAPPQHLQQQEWASNKRPFPGSQGIAVVPESSAAAPLPTGSMLGPPPKRPRQPAAAGQACQNARPQLLPGVSLPKCSPQQQQAGDSLRSPDLLHSIQAALHLGNAEAVAAPEQELFGTSSSSSSGEDEEASTGPGATVTWQGALKHKLGGTVVELCHMSVVLPKGFVEQFPAAVYASELLHRRQVSLGKHAVCRCSLGSLSARQLQGLATLAQCQLVAIVRLQHCALHLVPYFDNAQCMRMVGFLKAVPA